MTLEEYALSATVAALAGILLVILALVYQSHAPATVKPYTYSTSVMHNGHMVTCTMDVDSNGNGSLDNCRTAQ